MTEHRTGRVVNHDPRSRNFAHRPVLMLRPRSVLHTLEADALDQGNLGACTGFAAAQWLNCSRTQSARRRFNETQMRVKTYRLRNEHGVLLYRKATEEDELGWTYPPTDDGSSGLGVAKALKGFKAITRYEWTFTFEDFIAAATRQPVIVGTVWPDSMFDPDKLGVIRATTSFDVGGHEYLVRGVNYVREQVRIRNNWTKDWGIDGDAYIPFADMRRLLAAQGDCLVPVIP